MSRIIEYTGKTCKKDKSKYKINRIYQDRLDSIGKEYEKLKDRYNLYRLNEKEELIKDEIYQKVTELIGKTRAISASFIP